MKWVLGSLQKFHCLSFSWWHGARGQHLLQLTRIGWVRRTSGHAHFNKCIWAWYTDSESESDVTYSQVWRPILGIRALHLPIQVHTQTAVNTHTHMGSHLCCGVRGALGGLVPCSRATRRGIEGGEGAVHSLPQTTISARPRLELATFRLRVRISDPIRPRLPHDRW